MQVYFDVNPAARLPGSLQRPSPGAQDMVAGDTASFNNKANFEARSLTPESRETTAGSEFHPPQRRGNQNGAKVEFIFKTGDLFCPPFRSADTPVDRLLDAALKRSGGVTILNNVIDSNKREKTLTVEMPKSGTSSSTSSPWTATSCARLNATKGRHHLLGRNEPRKSIARGMYHPSSARKWTNRKVRL